MASRLHRHEGLARLACVALGIAISLIAGAARAQQAAVSGLDLRGEQIEPPPSDASAEPPDEEAAPEPKARPRKLALPALQPYQGAQRLGLRGGPPTPPQGAIPAPTVAALPTPAKPKRPREEDKPFDPVGVQIGGLKLTPFVEEDVGWSSNPGNLPGPQKSSAFLTSQAGFGLDSDWSTTAVHGNILGGFTDYFSNHAASAPFANGVFDGRLDVSRNASLDAEARLVLTELTAGSLGLGPNVSLRSGLPLTAVYGGTVGGDKKIGPLDLSLHGSLDRTAYQNATFSNGHVDELSSDNFNDWGLRVRATYAVSPEFRPFIDVAVDTRRYDLGRDQYGYERNSDGVAARVGADVELTHVLTGSFDVGYGERNYQDPRLPNLASPLIDAALIWTATPLTTVTLKSASSLVDTTIPGASGAAQHASTLEIDHALRRYLTLTGTVSYVTDAYVGVPWRDDTMTFSLAANYSLNRDVVLKASVSRQIYKSNQPGTDYNATVVMMGLKIQR